MLKPNANLVNFDEEVVIWGCGATFFYCEKVFSYENIKIKYIVDADLKKQGAILSGCEVKDPSVLAKEDSVIILVTAMNEKICEDIKNNALQINNKLKVFQFDDYVLSKNIQAVNEVTQMFEDETSRSAYEAVISARMNSRNVPQSAISSPSLRDNFGPVFGNAHINDVIIDAGAFVGDSMERFLFDHGGALKRYYAFEPDPRNYKALLARRKRLVEEWAFDEDAIVTVPAGLSDVTGSQTLRRWDGGGFGSSLELAASQERERERERERESIMCALNRSQTSEVATTRLDDFVTDSPITFLKADIEGAEMAMLAGAVETLKKFKPRLSITLYHHPSDMYRIPLFLKNLNLGYKFDFHHYMPVWEESILYAY